MIRATLPHSVLALMVQRRTAASRLPAWTMRDDPRVHRLQELDDQIAAAAADAGLDELTAWKLFDGNISHA